MATPNVLHLAVANRGKRGAIKTLPASIDIPASGTIEQLQIALAKEARVSDFNRIGIFDPTTRKILRDRRAVLGQQENIAVTGDVLVQDLGPQIAWRTVFAVEYAGPILIHVFFYWLRPAIPFLPASWTAGVEATSVDAPTDVQTLVFVLFLLHFAKRELETLFLHRFAANTMPAFNIFRNSAFYWLMAGLSCAWSLYAPLSPMRVSFPLSERLAVAAPARVGFGSTPVDFFGLALFAVSELCNFSVHYHLAHLRKPGSTEKGIPSCIGSSLVTSPNYMFEVLAWVGVILISRDVTVVAFILVGISYMRSWSRDKERALRRLFPDKYKKKQYTMLPGLI